METEQLTLKQLDGLVLDYVAKREAYDAARAVSNDREKEKYQAEVALLNALKTHDKKSYAVAGVGTISRREKLAVRVPDGDNKRAFLEYLQGRGEDFFFGLITVNYNTLNSFYASELEAAEAKGVFPFVLPGIEEPVLNEGIAFRKDTKHVEGTSNTSSKEGKTRSVSTQGGNGTF